MTDTSKDVTRYDETWEDMGHSIDGDYVTHEDYAALSAQLEAANARAYSLAYAIAGGEDVPGFLDSVNTDELCKILKSQRAWAQDAEFSARAEGKAEGLQEAADACEAQKVSFLSPEYATHQPLSSYSERFACGVCAAAILALIPADTPAAKVTLGFLRPIWKDHSGEWHGPKVERWSIPEDQMVTFFNAALRAIAGEKP